MNYYEIPRISNSGLSCIDPETGGHPEKYRDFIDGRYKQESPSMSLGDIIHRYLLLNETFVSLDKRPGDVIVKILDDYYSGLKEKYPLPFDIDSEREMLLKIIRFYGYYNNRKDETVLEGVIKEGEDYFKFLLQNNGKTAIPSEWQAILEKLTLSMLRGAVPEIFNPVDKTGLEILSEYEILFDIEANSYQGESELFECKAKIDRLIVDHKSKTYRIIDLKSTSGLLEMFTDSVKRYKYHRQLAFYREAVRQKLPGNYTEEGVYILALETTGYCRARLFLLDTDTLQAGTNDYQNLLKRISYHTATFNWIYPLEEEENQGIYRLNTT